MSDQKKIQNTQSLNQTLDYVLKLINGSYETRLPISNSGEGINELNAALNALAKNLQEKELQEKKDKKRIGEITDLLLEYSVMNFSKKANLSENGDDIDSIAAGFNVLGQEMEALNLSQKNYTSQLEELNTLLKQSHEKIQTIFNNANDAIIAMALDFTITEWNKGAEQIYGYSREEVIGKSVREIINTELPLPYTKEQLPGKNVLSGEAIQTTGRRGKINVLSSISYLKNDEGIPVGYICINRDITNDRKLHEELRRTEKLYHLLVNEVQDYAIILLDKDGNVMSWNKGAEKIKGYTESEIIGKHFSIFYPEEDQINNLPEKALDQARNEKRHVFQGWIVRKDKSLFWADVVITELVDENGNSRGFVKIIKDLSDRRKVEEEILKKGEELRRSNAELEQFAYVASHDLQEPLRMITSYVQLLEKHYKDKLGDDANDFINYAVDGANRMRTLIYSLLEYSRTNRVKSFEFFNLNDVLNEVITDLTILIKETNTKIVSTNMPIIYGDKVLIGQLFFNLIANAIKFKSDKPPEIVINWKKQLNEYMFSVKDNGIGIKKEYFEKIFIIFQRLHSKDKYPGTGIGLAICKKIVDKHEGKIWVESELNKGSTFYFTINAELRDPA